MQNAADTQPIYLITDGGALRSKGLLVERVAEILKAAAGAVSFVQLREQSSNSEYPPASEEELAQLISQLAPLCQNHNAKLVVNRRTDLLGSADVAGVHLGAPPSSIAEVRTSFPNTIIGYSAHSIAEVLEAEAAGANYALLSPIFSPLSKVDSRPTLGVTELSNASNQLSIPLYALGGISTETAPRCRAAGAYGVATLSFLLLAEHPAQATQALLDAWNQ